GQRGCGRRGRLSGDLSAAAAAAVSARRRCRSGAWAVPVVLFATSSRTTIMASSFSDADLATATALFAGLVFAVPRDGAEGRGEVVADTCYAALLTGVALGEKVNAVPAALIILAMTVVRARRCLDGAPR